MSEHVVVVGGGMVAHRFVEALRARDTEGAYRVTVVAEEDRAPYDRVGLSAFFSGSTPEDLTLGDPAQWESPATTLRTGSRAVSLDREAQSVTTADGTTLAYDHLVLATGSYAWVPPVPGADLAGGGTASATKRPDELADADRVCTCNSVTAGRIRDAVRGGCASVADVAARTRASTGCGDCASVVQALISSGTPTDNTSSETVTDSTTETGAKALVRSQP